MPKAPNSTAGWPAESIGIYWGNGLKHFSPTAGLPDCRTNVVYSRVALTLISIFSDSQTAIKPRCE